MPVVSGTAYATRTDLAALGILGNALSGITTDKQDAALLAASALVDSYVKSQTDVPLTQWTTAITRAVAIIAAYDLTTSSGYQLSEGADSNIRERYLDVMAWLKDIANDVVSIASTGISATPTSGFIFSSSDPRGWTHRGFEDN